MWGKNIIMIISKASGRSYNPKSIFVCKTKTYIGSKIILNTYINLKQKIKKNKIEILQIKSLLFLPSTLSNFHVVLF